MKNSEIFLRAMEIAWSTSNAFYAIEKAEDERDHTKGCIAYQLIDEFWSQFGDYGNDQEALLLALGLMSEIAKDAERRKP